ncbi:unnamed protein product [Arabidopsis arenosa]|uniref:SWIM-type domain-containing protein n=1 Tax=Arabidopsis arenosa TaxID=38785 RepID=A0A8S2AZV4_ARAAE|nr:unnamed protein product [Arabidopsis arenosa]
MSLIVRLVRGEWKRDETGCYEHVSEIEGFCLAVRLREKDSYARVVEVVKDKLKLRPEDDIELSYQWPQWMMGPDWQRANPIHIHDDEDMSLFMAIRADLEEMHLKVKIVRGTMTERTVNSYRSHIDIGSMSAEAISDRYWNSAETRAVWNTAVTRMLLRNLSDNAAGSSSPHVTQPEGMAGAMGRKQAGGIVINDNQGITGVGSVDPINMTQPENGVSAKGKEPAIDEETRRDLEFEMWRRNKQAEMLKEIYATEMTLGVPERTEEEKTPEKRTARALDFGDQNKDGTNPNIEVQLTLASAEPNTDGPMIVSVSSTDSTYGTPTELSASLSFDSDELMDDTDISSNNCLSQIGEDMLAHYYSDPDGPLCMGPTDTTNMNKRKAVSAPGAKTFQDLGEASTARVGAKMGEMVLKEIPVPTVLYDRDAPPYFDDPGEEDYLHRALMDADYEGDDIFIGRLFKSKEDCATKLAIHAIRRKFHFIYAKSCPNILLAVCVSHTCQWRVYATKLEDSERFEVKSATLHHTCSVDARGDFHKQASTAVIGKLMRTKYLGVGGGPRPNELRKMLRQEFSLNVSYWKAWRAREIAMDNAMGSAMGSYALIQPYFKLLLETNPNSLVALETEKDSSGGVYPMASHAACVVHLKRNIVAMFKSEALSVLVARAARAYRLSDFNGIFAEIRAMHPPCADYLTGIGFEHWTRSHFVGDRFNFMTSNIAESLNNVLTMARDYPVISILESLRTTLVTWFALRREAAQQEGNILPPKVNEMVIENFEKGAGYVVLKIGEANYEVRDRNDSGFAVNLWERTCTCREFQLLTIPCSHAIAAAIKEGIRVDTMVGIHHTVPHLRLAYQGIIMPVPDMDTLTPSPDDIGGGKLAPPYVRRPPGRPRKRRMLSRGEFKNFGEKVFTLQGNWPQQGNMPWADSGTIPTNLPYEC